MYGNIRSYSRHRRINQSSLVVVRVAQHDVILTGTLMMKLGFPRYEMQSKRRAVSPVSEHQDMLPSSILVWGRDQLEDVAEAPGPSRLIYESSILRTPSHWH